MQVQEQARDAHISIHPHTSALGLRAAPIRMRCLGFGAPTIAYRRGVGLRLGYKFK